MLVLRRGRRRDGVALSRLIAERHELLGGWLAVIGALPILIGATLGYPLRSDLRTSRS